VDGTVSKPRTMDATSFSDARILIVDDQPANVVLLEQLLAMWGYANVVGTSRSADVVPMCREAQPDLVLLDLHMPDPDGFRVLELLTEWTTGEARLPVLVLTADVTREARHRALELGARDFVGKPFDAIEVQLRVRNLLDVRRLQLELERQNESLAGRVRERTRDLEAARAELLDRLALAAEYRDDDTQEHARRIGRTSGLLAHWLGLGFDTRELIIRAAQLHDVGKIGIPDAILLKPGRLTDAELEVMKRHTRIGADLLAGGVSPVLKLAREIALTHHERWDGTGYPHRLAGTAIPLVGRIVAVADVFDALTHARPYKDAWPVDQAVEEIRAQSGRQFDPAVVEAFEGLEHGALAAAHDTARGPRRLADLTYGG
jgi:putative two-component system response regulator